MQTGTQLLCAFTRVYIHTVFINPLYRSRIVLPKEIQVANHIILHYSNYLKDIVTVCPIVPNSTFQPRYLLNNLWYKLCLAVSTNPEPLYHHSYPVPITLSPTLMDQVYPKVQKLNECVSCTAASETLLRLCPGGTLPDRQWRRLRWSSSLPAAWEIRYILGMDTMAVYHVAADWDGITGPLPTGISDP